MSISSFLAKWKANKEQFKEMQRLDKLQTVVEQRKKNANERELEGYMEEERQKQIKVQLDHYRQKKKDEMRQTTMLGHKSIFNHKATMLKDNNKLFKGRSGILKQKGVFLK
jgi:hypothetical protein